MDNHIIYAQGAIAILRSEGHLESYVANLNITPDDFKLITGDQIWLPVDRNRATQALDKLIYGSGDMVGMTRESFTAEWVAIMIISLVKPFNWHYACTVQSNLSRSQDVIRNGDLQLVQVDRTITTKHLMAMCHTMLGQIDPKIFDDFQKKAFAKVLGASKQVAK